MRGRYAALSIIALATGIAGGVAFERFYLDADGGAATAGPEILYWVAPMDPNFRRDGPGKSPMGMDLIPVYAGQEPGGDPEVVKLDAAEINAIGVRTALARVDDISPRIETVGFVGYDQHLTSHVHTRVDGWIETLQVRAVGDRVRQGDVLFELFSPEFSVASFDFLRSLQNGAGISVEAARNKLRSHGASDAQIAEIERTGKVARRIKVEAPRDGVVVALAAADGMFLQPNTQAVSITDLNRVWLIADIFERDMGRLSQDMRAVARFEHLPGRVFEGEIDYVYPELDVRTRTLPIRLRFDNREGLLRPGMFGSVSLVPSTGRAALTVPSEAIIRTGSAERVILRTGEGTFRPRLVTTGQRDRFGESGRTEILQGLAPGEEVVASAQFLIDSESALSAGFMRMAPTQAEPARGAGVLVALDRDDRMATIRHEALDSLGWPAMTSRFPISADIPLDRLREGEAVSFRVVRGADGLLGLMELGTDDGIAATGKGLALGVTSDGKLTLSHDPIPELGWPSMQMDMPLVGVDAGSVPLDTPIEFDLAKGEGGLFAIVAVRSAGQDAEAAKAAPEAAANAPSETGLAHIVVSGTVDAVDPLARKAKVTHGPMVEIGMPGMTMDFPLDEGLDPDSLAIGVEATLTLVRPDGPTMVLAAVEPMLPPMKVAGRINSIDLETRRANVTHGPMADIGMPGMTMDFAVADALDPATLPVGRDLTLLLKRNPDFTLTLVGAVPAGEAAR